MIVNKKIKVRLVRSLIGRKISHCNTVYGLGLRRLQQSIELSPTPEILGMLNKVAYLLKCEECDAT